jgi:8-oxo-dGTP pyrophosphatase MutT (NUDIX family)
VTEPHLAALNENLKRAAARRDSPALKPRDAATLILVDRTDPETPRILFGRRNPSLRFLPDKFVFPGGAVDPMDRQIASVGALASSCAARLASGISRGGATRTRALALAAIRELAEETGLYLGVPNASANAAKCWPDFEAAGVTPSLDGVFFAARAITPPTSPRRYDTRFFLADASGIAARVHGRVGADCELVELAWATAEEARDLDLHVMTRAILTELAGRLRPGGISDGPVPCLRVRNGRFVRELIEG